jgi:hypothetical protein
MIAVTASGSPTKNVMGTNGENPDYAGDECRDSEPVRGSEDVGPMAGETYGCESVIVALPWVTGAGTRAS